MLLPPQWVELHLDLTLLGVAPGYEATAPREAGGYASRPRRDAGDFLWTYHTR